MPPKPIAILKKGLSKFMKSITACKDLLTAKLCQKETISSSDEYWLDHEANTVDKQCVLEALESSSDYERGLKHLDDQGRAIVMKLKEWSSEVLKVAGNKYKCPANNTTKENASLAQRIEILD
ncbi:hypothetical protein BDQ17DRAFT_1439573 [Cyathus striatus]|nr:hypothetical protein BDQ17DRAFT_1439573 [Cyathus striatus]